MRFYLSVRFPISSGKCPDFDSVEIIKAFSKACNEIRLYEKSTVQNWSMLITTALMEDCALCEMAFAGRVGITINLDLLTIDSVAKVGETLKSELSMQLNAEIVSQSTLFNEELGVVADNKAKALCFFDVFDQLD